MSQIIFTKYRSQIILKTLEVFPSYSMEMLMKLVTMMMMMTTTMTTTKSDDMTMMTIQEISDQFPFLSGFSTFINV